MTSSRVRASDTFGQGDIEDIRIDLRDAEQRVVDLRIRLLSALMAEHPMKADRIYLSRGGDRWRITGFRLSPSDELAWPKLIRIDLDGQEIPDSHALALHPEQWTAE